MDYVADFETTTEETDCRVWAWGLCSIKKLEFIHGNSMDGFMNKLRYDKEISKIYFHNLKFDGEFVENWLFRNGFRHTLERKVYPGEFSSLISDMGTFYQLKINFGTNTVTVQDSLKLIPMAVSKISKAFGLDENKGEIDYRKFRPVGYILDNDEVEYLRKDCALVAKALSIMFDTGLQKMTTASNAMDSYKKLVNAKQFDKWFPVLEADKWLRRSYRGGFTYAAPQYQGREVGSGSVYDVNSLYPYVMYTYPMPFGQPLWFDGEYKEDKLYPLSIVSLTCRFELKQGMIPTLQLKGHSRFSDTEYLKDSGAEDVFLIMTDIDLELFLRHYHVYDLCYMGGYKFRASAEMFKVYIDKWTDVKIRATLEGNDGQRSIAKLMMNSLYGKFGLNPKVQSKIPSWDAENEMVKYRNGSEEWRKPIYVPVACFTTAYARRETITAAQRNYNRFLYADTDSVHLVGIETPQGVEVDKARLGAWKHEINFDRGKYIRAKSYVERVVWEEKKGDVTPYLKITCAGMPERCHEGVTFEMFEKGLVVGGKLQHKRVSGGVVLREVEFTMKG